MAVISNLTWVVASIIFLTLNHLVRASANDTASARVALGGEVASITEAPWVVAILAEAVITRATPPGQPICTGSIIEKEWVLTAAHCIVSPDVPSAMSVIAGGDSTKQFKNFNIVQKRVVKSTIIHESYWKNRVSKYDVALIRVDEFNFSDRVGKLALWATEWVKSNNTKYEYGTLTCKIFGWGSLELGIKTTVLRKSRMNIRHGTAACPCFKMFVQRRLICSHPNSVGGLCPGDSGGPLVCENKVTGIAHVIYNRKSCNPNYFGEIKLKCNSPDSISAWMYVCPMLDFINEHVPSVPKQPLSCRGSRHTAPISALIVIALICW